jgi:type II secretory pathway pseudopilin PulG
MSFVKHKANLIKNKRGFTLAELILSIGMISITGIVAINLFLTSDTLNKKANDIDKCVFTSSGIIESIKTGYSPEDLTMHDFMKNAIFETSISDVKARLYFNSDWEPLSENTEDTMYIIETVISPVKSNIISDTWAVKVTCTRQKKYYPVSDGSIVIFELETSVYFSQDDLMTGGSR